MMNDFVSAKDRLNFPRSKYVGLFTDIMFVAIFILTIGLVHSGGN